MEEVVITQNRNSLLYRNSFAYQRGRHAQGKKGKGDKSLRVVPSKGSWRVKNGGKGPGKRKEWE